MLNIRTHFPRVLITILTIAVLTQAASMAGEGPPKAGEQAKDFSLDAIGGGKVRLSDLTKVGPVVLVVLRGYPGYQCPACQAQVADLAARSDELAMRNARVVLVYPGPSEMLKAHADEFLKGKSLPEGFDLLLDPDYTFTGLYGLRWDAANETAYPSTFVLKKGGTVAFAKVSRTHGGRASAAEVIKALGARPAK